MVFATEGSHLAPCNNIQLRNPGSFSLGDRSGGASHSGSTLARQSISDSIRLMRQWRSTFYVSFAIDRGLHPNAKEKRSQNRVR